MKPQPKPPKSLRENALHLLQAGQPAKQIATALQVPVGKIYYWKRYYMNPLAHVEDGRRLYNEAFKQAVFEQLTTGASVSQVARTLSVSKVTLFNWKKEWQQAPEGGNKDQKKDLATEDTQSNELPEKGLFLPQRIVASLFERIRALEVEQERLKAALALTTDIAQ